jgi:predicted HTH transcriptional regulator
MYGEFHAPSPPRPLLPGPLPDIRGIKPGQVVMSTNDPAALLCRLLEEKAETEWLEFKHNNCEADEIGRCVSACSNAAMLRGRERAFMVWGIENGTKRRVGTSVRLAQIKKGGENLANWLGRIVEPRLMMELLDFEDQGLQFSILVIEPGYDRPIKFAGEAYIRIGENTKKLKDFSDHERTLWLATSRRKFEEAVASTHRSQSEVLGSLDVPAFYKLMHEEVPQSTDEIMRRFCSIGFLRDDMEGGYDITNLGAILFAQDIAQFPSIASKSIRVVKYLGLDKRKSEAEIEGKKGYAVGFSGLIRYVMDRLPSEEKYDGGVRKMEPVYPFTAVREVVANALIHQDFTINGAGPLIEIYSDRVEVINPGNSLISVDRIIDERRSRNEKLASVMRDLGLCEERGGGIDKAIFEIEEKALPTLEFIASENAMRVVLFGPKRFGDLSKSDRVWACFCHCVIRWLRHDYMSNTSLRERFSLPDEEYQAISVVISDARKQGRIVPADPDQGKRNARYVPYWAR